MLFPYGFCVAHGLLDMFVAFLLWEGDMGGKVDCVHLKVRVRLGRKSMAGVGGHVVSGVRRQREGDLPVTVSPGWLQACLIGVEMSPECGAVCVGHGSSRSPAVSCYLVPGLLEIGSQRLVPSAFPGLSLVAGMALLLDSLAP